MVADVEAVAIGAPRQRLGMAPDVDHAHQTGVILVARALTRQPDVDAVAVRVGREIGYDIAVERGNGIGRCAPPRRSPRCGHHRVH